MAYAQDKRLSHTITLIAAGVAVAIAVLLPLVHFVQGWRLLERELVLKATVKAELVSQLVARSPDTWQYQDTRLIELLRRAPVELGRDEGRLVDAKGAKFIAVDGAPGPMYWASAPVLDSGVAVAEVRVGRSIAGLALSTAAWALAGLGLGSVIFVTLRLLPLRALDAAGDALSAHLRFQEKVAGFGAAALGQNDPQQLIREAIERLLEGLRAHAVAYIEKPPGGEELRVRGLTGVPDAHDATAPYRRGGLLARVLEEGKALHVGHAELVRSPLPFGWARAARAAALVPIYDGERVRGALCALPEGGERFTAQALKFIESTASLLSAGLRRIDTEGRLIALAQYDALTRLPNRAAMKDRLTQLLNHAERHQRSLGLLFIDLDEFKLVNDSLGHAAGDEVLRETAKRFLSCVRGSDIVARIGGDEFIIILAEMAQPEDAAAVARKVIETATVPHLLRGQLVCVTASAGIATFPGDAGEPEALIAAADSAMYRAKQAGRNGYRFYGEQGTQATLI